MSTAVTNANAEANPSCPTLPLGAVHQDLDPTTKTVVKFDGKSSLKPGESVKSPNGKYSLEFKDGNLVLYSNNDDGSHQAKWWSSNTKDANRVDFQTDGNVVVYKDDNAKWASNTVCEEGWLPLRFTLDNEGQMFIVMHQLSSEMTRTYSPGSRGTGFSNVENIISFDPNGLFEVKKDKKCILKFQYQSPSKNSKKVTVPIDLNKVIGNSDGSLVLGDKDFAASSTDISAVVRNDTVNDYVYLQASCMKKDGKTVPGQLILDKSFFVSFVNQVAKTTRLAFKKRSASGRGTFKNTNSIYWAFNDQEYEPNDKDFNFKTPNGKYQLVFQGDGDLVLYECNAEGRTAKWDAFASKTRHSGWSDAKKLRLQKDGNMVIYDSDGKSLWASCPDKHDEYLVHVKWSRAVGRCSPKPQNYYYARGKFLNLTNDGEFAIIAVGVHESGCPIEKNALSKYNFVPAAKYGKFGEPDPLNWKLTLGCAAGSLFLMGAFGLAACCLPAASGAAVAEGEVIAANVGVLEEEGSTAALEFQIIEEDIGMEVDEAMKEAVILGESTFEADFAALSSESAEYLLCNESVSSFAEAVSLGGNAVEEEGFAELAQSLDKLGFSDYEGQVESILREFGPDSFFTPRV
jgi:hypothetical protein